MDATRLNCCLLLEKKEQEKTEKKKNTPRNERTNERTNKPLEAWLPSAVGKTKKSRNHTRVRHSISDIFLSPLHRLEYSSLKLPYDVYSSSAAGRSFVVLAHATYGTSSTHRCLSFQSAVALVVAPRASDPPGQAMTNARHNTSITFLTTFLGLGFLTTGPFDADGSGLKRKDTTRSTTSACMHTNITGNQH